ncbi:MAG TPA: helical backbone metal receptor [Spirochaetota bacterium]|nr:helical backbone metal receptor [Spirochaetota bacterium]
MSSKIIVSFFWFFLIVSALSAHDKIVSLTPSITKILFHLNLENDIIGVTDYCEFQGKVKKLVEEGKIKRVSGFNAINYEKILLINPDIILGMDSISMESKKNLDKLFKNKKIYWFRHPRNFEEIKKQIIEIGKVVKKEDKSLEMVNFIEKELKIVENKVKNIPDNLKPKILVEIHYPPFTTAGINTFVSDIILKAGGRLALNIKDDWANISMEDIFAASPDIIVKSRLTENNHNLDAIEAYKKNRIFIPSNVDFILQPGVENVFAVKELYDYIINLGRLTKPK